MIGPATKMKMKVRPMMPTFLLVSSLQPMFEGALEGTMTCRFCRFRLMALPPCCYLAIVFCASVCRLARERFAMTCSRTIPKIETTMNASGNHASFLNCSATRTIALASATIPKPSWYARSSCTFLLPPCLSLSESTRFFIISQPLCQRFFELVYCGYYD